MESEWDYRLTEKADADLDDVVQYIAVELANPKAASDFVDKLQSAIEEARSFPESGSLVINEYLPDSEQKTIFVLRIVYGRRNIDEILRQISR